MVAHQVRRKAPARAENGRGSKVAPKKAATRTKAASSRPARKA
jgi:hypothetical protein